MTLQELEETPYPPAPWRAKGQIWMGAFEVESPLPLPAGLRPVLSPKWISVLVVRYLEGTLKYDELAICSLARRGLRFGAYVHHIWVDSVPSLWGGRRIWGLPKELATFAWDGDTVRVTDNEGPIATITVNRRTGQLPPLGLFSPGFGVLDGRLVQASAFLKGPVGRSGMRVEEWSSRFPYRAMGTPRFSFSINPMAITVNAAVAIE